MSKKIESFTTMCQADQIALLKGGKSNRSENYGKSISHVFDRNFVKVSEFWKYEFIFQAVLN